MAQTGSVRRRSYRFFQFVRLDSTLAARVVVELLGLSGKPWVLAIDRTNWDFGKTTINILMISVTWSGMGILLRWMMLPTAGNSSTSERTELLDRLRAAFPDMRIAALMGDREFIGNAWMAYLQRQTSASSSTGDRRSQQALARSSMRPLAQRSKSSRSRPCRNWSDPRSRVVQRA